MQNYKFLDFYEKRNLKKLSIFQLLLSKPPLNKLYFKYIILIVSYNNIAIIINKIKENKVLTKHCLCVSCRGYHFRKFTTLYVSVKCMYTFSASTQFLPQLFPLFFSLFYNLLQFIKIQYSFGRNRNIKILLRIKNFSLKVLLLSFKCLNQLLK